VGVLRFRFRALREGTWKMASSDEYQARARECIEAADRLKHPANRLAFLELARRWMHFAFKVKVVEDRKGVKANGPLIWDSQKSGNSSANPHMRCKPVGHPPIPLPVRLARKLGSPRSCQAPGAFSFSTAADLVPGHRCAMIAAMEIDGYWRTRTISEAQAQGYTHL
jgi:hypothetical protein